MIFGFKELGGHQLVNTAETFGLYDCEALILGCIVNLFRDKIKLKPGITKRQGDVALLLAHYQGINLLLAYVSL